MQNNPVFTLAWRLQYRKLYNRESIYTGICRSMYNPVFTLFSIASINMQDNPVFTLAWRLQYRIDMQYNHGPTYNGITCRSMYNPIIIHYGMALSASHRQAG